MRSMALWAVLALPLIAGQAHANALHTAGLLTTCGSVGLRGHVPTEDTALVARLRHAGAIFLGRHTPEAMGDYIAGPNHVLPTASTAALSQPATAATAPKNPRATST